MKPRRRRPSVPYTVQLQVYFRDRWLCYLCRSPLIFPPALSRLAALVGGDSGVPVPAYFNAQWRRDKAPLLDELACSVDHVEAFATGGAHGIENFAAICARCNARKSSRKKDEYLTKAKPWKVHGKHGEPTEWDGLVSVFMTLADGASDLSSTERNWLRALRLHLQPRASAERRSKGG